MMTTYMCITAQILLLESEPLLSLHMPITATFVPRTAHFVAEALLFSFHMVFACTVGEPLWRRVQRDTEFPTWLPGPRTVTIKRQENPAPQDHRQITCLNNIYKVVTSVINEALKSHEKFQQLLQLDQRGSKPSSMGCIDDLLLDKAILEDAKGTEKIFHAPGSTFKRPMTRSHTTG